MAKTTINNGDTGLLVRTAINDNFTEVYQTDSQVRALSGNWQNTSTVVQSNSAQWAVDSTTDTGVRALSANWQNTSTAYQSASASFATLSASTATQANLAIVNSHAGQTNSALVLTPKGTGSLIAGPKPDGTSTGGNLRGTNAVDLQTVRVLATQVASGLRAFIGGGTGNTASQSICVALGAYGAATGVNSFAIGLNGGGSATCTAVAESSVAVGYGVRADRLAMIAYAQGQFSAQGDAQRARFVLRNKTTTNSAVELFLDGSSTRLTIPSGKIVAFTINIAGVSSTGGAVAHFMRQYCLKNVAGTTTEVYAPVTIGTDNAAGTSIAISASDASDALIVSVTGTASTIWRWVASVDAVEIAYGV